MSDTPGHSDSGRGLGDKLHGNVSGDGIVSLDDLNAVRNNFGAVAVRQDRPRSNPRSSAVQIAKLGDAVDLLFSALGAETRDKPNGRVARWL